MSIVKGIDLKKTAKNRFNFLSLNDIIILGEKMNTAQLEINMDVLQENCQKLTKNYQDYAYKLVDLRNNVYGLGYFLVNELSNYFNYGLVTNVQEALRVRKYNQEFPLLIKEHPFEEEIYDAINNNLTITINDLNYLQKISSLKIKDDLKIHLFIDNGSPVIGLKTTEEVKKAIEIINSNRHLVLEGIYTDISTYGCDEEYYYHQMNRFLKIIEPIHSKNLIIHSNEPLMYHQKLEMVNGLKFDLSIWGLTQNFANCNNLKQNRIKKKYNSFQDIDLNLELPWALTAGIKTISGVEKGTLIGSKYLAKENMRVAVLNIGHKDGITKALKVIVINNEICEILADNVDELIVKIGNNISLEDKAYIISEYNNIDNVLLNLKTNRYYLMSILNNNLKRVYISNDNEEEIAY